MTASSNNKPTSSSTPVLQAEDLRKFYGPREALRGLSFSLQAGHILGFLGPNGAGKTTAIRILTTILKPDSGRFTVDGITSEEPIKIRSRIGVLPETLGFHKQMTGLECLVFFGQLYGRSAAEAREVGKALLKDVGLDQRSKSLVGSYSRGMRQRLGIARSLINDPAVVFLDEPTLGLDPHGQQDLLELVRWIARERNAGVVLCSHLLAEVESVCDDVVIMSGGQIISSGTVDEVIGKNRRGNIRIHVPSPSIADTRQILEAMPEIKKVTATDKDSGWLDVDLQNETVNNPAADQYLNNRILGALIRAEIPILSYEAEGNRLQDVFLQLTKEEVIL